MRNRQELSGLEEPRASAALRVQRRSIEGLLDCDDKLIMLDSHESRSAV